MSVAPDEPIFPYGYLRPPDGGPQGMGTMLTWDQMMTKSTVNRLHPEVLRRFEALIHFAYDVGVPLGCGTGWRSIQPDKPGFAKNGNSWHQSCPLSPTSATAFAIDTVPNTSWAWLEERCSNFGFRTFRLINNEPWHIQPTEIPASRKYATSPPPHYIWRLPESPLVTPPPIIVVTPPPVTTPPPTTGGTFTLQLQKTELSPAKQAQIKGNGDVYLVQQIAQGWYRQSGNTDLDCGKPDGDYGSRTQKAVKVMQAMNGLTQDAICGPKTWAGILNSDGQ